MSLDWLNRTSEKLREASILYAFDRNGFAAHQKKFHDEDLSHDLHGRVCVVTGTPRGIAKEVALQLARRGAEIWLFTRRLERGVEARDSLIAESGNNNVHLELVDMASLADVSRVAATFQRPAIDVLIHHSTVLAHYRRTTSEGHELNWGTHVLVPHLLTELFRERLIAAEQGRVIYVTSPAMYTSRLQTQDVQWNGRIYDGFRAFAETKRAGTVLTRLWADTFAETKVTINAMHPGWTDTVAMREALPQFYKRLRHRLRTAEEGADTLLWLAVCPSVAQQSGHLWFDREIRREYFFPWTRESEPDRQTLWQLCQEQTSPWRDRPPRLVH
jgi:NAD(P)-dependent dehydrogenase (short-subunit alcohol dehydrogenase family)